MPTRERSPNEKWRSIGKLLCVCILVSLFLAAGVPASAAPDGEFKIRKEKKITQEDREAAAEDIKGAYEQALTEVAQMAPGEVAHYYGPFPNYANSPMPKGSIGSIIVENGGKGYPGNGQGNIVVTIVDVYGTGSGATAEAHASGGKITSIDLVSPGFGGTGYTAPRVIIEDATGGGGTGAVATATLDPNTLVPGTGIRKFVDSMPGLCPPLGTPNNLGQCIPRAIPDTMSYPEGGRGYTSTPTVVILDSTGTGAAATATLNGDIVSIVQVTSGGTGYSDRPVISFVGGGVDPTKGIGANAVGKATVVNGVITGITLVGSDYYEIELGEFTEEMHTDLPPTTLRGYRQVNTADPYASTFHSLGPMIIAQRDTPVRIKFINSLPAGTGGNLFIPVDTTVMGAGHGYLKGAELIPQNRATIHLHGGYTPWISDGTPFQWMTPAGATDPTGTAPTSYPQGVSVYNVPDMPDWGPNPTQGVLTFYYTNQQSARLMFYHDHAHGITRLNVYAGEAAPYLVTDQVERDMVEGTDLSGVNPSKLNVLPPDNLGYGIPLVIQDKTFVDPATIAKQDPTWNWGTTPPMPKLGDLWYPHVYMPAQNPWAPDGVNAFGRWAYGPWFWPPTDVPYGPVNNIYHNPQNPDPMEPPLVPGTPNPSMAMEAFMDTPVVNGAPYPYLVVEPRAYRFRILNAADDRFLNLQLYEADPLDPRDVRMVPAVPTIGFPATWPTDGRAGGVPDPTLPGPDFIQIGNEGGFLPAPVVVPNQPVTWVTDPTVFNAGNVDLHSLLIAPAERADVIVDFTDFHDKTLILYNDAPAAFPALDPRYDYYTGHPDLTDTGGTPPTLPGYGPNTRTIMQIRVGPPGPTTPEVTLGNLISVFAKNIATHKRGVFEVSQDPPISAVAGYNTAYDASFPVDNFVRISDTSYKFKTVTGTEVTLPMQRKAIQDEQGEAFDAYGRLSGFLGLQVAVAPGQMQLLLYGYESPPVDILTDTVSGTKIGELGDGTQIWKITHNGVDTHPVHWHLFNVQVINRVGWDGIIRAPDANELGWKETLRVSPLEDTIVAMRPVTPWLPWDLPNSFRPIDPTEPMGALLTGAPGAQPQFFDPSAEPVSVYNKLVNYGWEYVFHCHILAHEEMDMMHGMVVGVPPRAPMNLAASLSGSGKNLLAALTWDDTSASETKFIVQRSSTSAGPWAAIATIPSTVTGPTKGQITYGDRTIVKGQTYFYRVIASNVVGDTTVYPAPAIGFPNIALDSAPSNIASVGYIAGTPPAAPTTLVATLVTGPQIALTWTDHASDETGFVVERAVDGGAFSPLTTVGPRSGSRNTVSYTDATVTFGHKYVYRVAAVNGAGMSAYTNTASVTILGILAAPTSLVGTLQAGSQVALTWMDNANDETGFLIERAMDGGAFSFLKSLGANPGISTVGYTDTGLLGGHTYAYRVAAIRNLEVSPYSNTASVTVPGALPAPTILTVTAARWGGGPNDRITLTWTDVAGETGYTIQQATDQTFTTGLVTYVVAANSQTFTTGNVPRFTTFFFRIQSFSATDRSGWSNIMSVTTP